MEAMYETEMEFSPVFIGLGKICEKQKKYEEAEKNYIMMIIKMRREIKKYIKK